MEALHLCEAVDLVQIVADVAWRGIRIDRPKQQGAKGQPAGYPVARGGLVGLNEREWLLWMHGDVRGISDRGSYFREAAAHRDRYDWCVTQAMFHGMKRRAQRSLLRK